MIIYNYEKPSLPRIKQFMVFWGKTRFGGCLHIAVKLPRILILPFKYDIDRYRTKFTPALWTGRTREFVVHWPEFGFYLRSPSGREWFHVRECCYTQWISSALYKIGR